MPTNRVPAASAASALPTASSPGLATVMLPFALAHFMSYLFRCVNAVVYPDLVRDVGLTPNTLGLLTGAYFIAFAVAQLPVGIALDRFGPRRVQVPMLLVAALGGWLFAQAESFMALVLARGLIGLGVAASLMAAIKANSLWLPAARLPLSTAVLLAVGGLGALAATAPLQVVLGWVGWRGAFVGMALATAGVSLLIWAVAPTPAQAAPVPVRQMARSVAQLYRSAGFWRIAVCTLFANATYMAVQSLWMGPWLTDVAHLPRPVMSQVLFAGTVAMVAGSLGFGWITDRLRRHGVRPAMVCGTGVAVFWGFQGLMLLGDAVNPWFVAIGFSFFGTAAAMNYAIVAQSVPLHLTGRVSTCFNLLIFLATFGVQWGMGAVIDAWSPQGGRYPAEAYRAAQLGAMALQLPGLLVWCRLRPWRRAG